MSSSSIVWLVIIIVVLVGGGWWFYTYSNGLPVVPDSVQNEGTGDNSQNGSGVDIGAGAGASIGGAPSSATVTYTAQGFSPQEVHIASGGTVTFVDENPSGGMWVASAQHPTHSVYSGTTLDQHCDTMSNDSFDQCEEGATYSFTFDKVGTWTYHNHSQSSHFGRVIVE
jgi:plastocyanin